MISKNTIAVIELMEDVCISGDLRTTTSTATPTVI